MPAQIVVHVRSPLFTLGRYARARYELSVFGQTQRPRTLATFRVNE
jgi:hypothetical protein